MAIFAVVLAAAVVLAWPGGDGRKVYAGHGPIEGHGGDSTTSGVVTEVGREHTNALISLESTIDEPIILERIRLDPPPDESSLEILDAFVASDPDRSTGGSFDGFPPQDLGRLVPVEGAVIAPRHSASLVIGARLTEPGTGYWKRLFVEFRVGNREYAVRYDDAYVLCAPVAKFERDGCANPYDANFDPDEAVRAAFDP